MEKSRSRRKLNSINTEKTTVKGPDRNSIKLNDRISDSQVPFTQRWSQINNDVKLAIQKWDDLHEKYTGKISRDEEQMNEIRGLLKKLKIKLDDFE